MVTKKKTKSPEKALTDLIKGVEKQRVEIQKLADLAESLSSDLNEALESLDEAHANFTDALTAVREAKGAARAVGNANDYLRRTV